MEHKQLDIINMIGDISNRLSAVKQEISEAAIRSGRTADAIRLVAVTKKQSASTIQAACEVGISEIGENYLQEADEKFSQLNWPFAPVKAPVIRHAIGHIQSNKVKLALRCFDIIETVDSLSLAQKINIIAGEQNRIVPILIQVNISCDEKKFGIFSEIEGFLVKMSNFAHIRVAGLMTIGRYEADPEAARGDFSALRELRDNLIRVMPSNISLTELSMGMSHDFPVAIEEGATIVRIGSRLFGAR